MADNKMMIFENVQFGQVRTVNMGGEPWFVANDVCMVLDIANPKDAIRKLDSDEKSGVGITDPHGRTQKTNCISESGLYTLVLRSRKPEAKEFRRWITHEVIPSIRKNGAYMTDAVIAHLEENPELVPEYLNHLRDENARAKELRRQLDTVTGQLAIAQPKADYYNAYVNNEDALCFRYVAKELGVPERKLINYLLDKHFLYRDAHRDSRVFPRAGDRNDPLFLVRDFHTRSGHRGQYTVLTVAGREHLMRRVGEISAYVTKKNRDIAPEICPISAETA